jgi:hypothetical protein
MDNGRQSVTEGGMMRKHKSCVGNWDLLKIQEVSYYIRLAFRYFDTDYY